MPRVSDLFKNNKSKKMNVFLILDASDCMRGEMIKALNHAIKELALALESVNTDIELSFNVLRCGGNPKWIISNSNSLARDWKSIEASGMLDISSACDMLNEKLNKSVEYSIEDYMPIIIIMNSCKACEHYEEAMDALNGNFWFKYSTKVAFALGEYSDLEMLKRFTGTVEAIIKTSDMHLVMRLLSSPRRMEDYEEVFRVLREKQLENNQEILMVKKRTIEKFSIELPCGTIQFDEGEYIVKECQVRACNIDSAENPLFSLRCELFRKDERRVVVHNLGKDNLILKHRVLKNGYSLVKNTINENIDFVIEANENLNKFQIRVLHNGNHLILQNRSDDFIEVGEVISPGESACMESYGELFLDDGTKCFSVLPLEYIEPEWEDDTEWW